MSKPRDDDPKWVRLCADAYESGSSITEIHRVTRVRGNHRHDCMMAKCRRPAIHGLWIEQGGEDSKDHRSTQRHVCDVHVHDFVGVSKMLIQAATIPDTPIKIKRPRAPVVRGGLKAELKLLEELIEREKPYPDHGMGDTTYLRDALLLVQKMRRREEGK